MSEHNGWVHSVVVFPDERTIASAGEDRTIRFWIPYSGVELFRRTEHSKGVTSIALTPDGKMMLSIGKDRTLYFWDVDSRQVHLEVKDVPATSLALSSDGRMAATGTNHPTGIVYLWNAKTGMDLGTLPEHGTVVKALAFLHDGTGLITSGGDGLVRVWDVATLRELMSIGGHSDNVRALATFPDGTFLSGSYDGTARLWSLALGSEVAMFAHPGPVHALAVLPDGKRFLSGCHDGVIRLWDRNIPQRALQTFEGHIEQVSSIAVFPGGKKFVSGSFDRTVRVWDIR
jgi:WD40 repeat protein